MSSCSLMHRRTRRIRALDQRRSRGFTLVEFMVAMTGGLFVTVAVFVLAQQGSRFYQRQARLSDANLASVIGFERLRTDIARAGFMASPNVRRDPRVCGSPVTDATWPTYLGRMASVFVEDSDTDDLPDLFAGNGLTPQRITLAGSYASIDQFDVRHIEDNGTNYEVWLNPTSGAMARIGFDPSESDAAGLAQVFAPGRALRLVDRDSGKHQYGEILSTTGGAQPRIVLRIDSPTLNFNECAACTNPICGFKSLQVGALANVVNFVRYEIRSLSDVARYAPIYAAAGPSYDTDRTELVRSELNVAGAVIAGTEELIAEYAVDLRFKVTVAPSASGAVIDIADDGLSAWAGDTTTPVVVGQGPQLIRSVRTWLSVRSREGDRNVDLPPPSGGPLYRIGLSDDGSAPFARVRTMQAHIALRNQLGVTWQ